MPHETLDQLRDLYKQSEEKTLKDFFSFLEFPSISSEEEYAPHVQACANWLKARLKGMGFETELWETSGHPCLFSSYMKAGPDKPTLLIYAHYDVQPVDPLELWESPPFHPAIRDGQIFARGALDDKGQCFYVLHALKLLLKRDETLPINIKLLIEGEEETGSEGLAGVLEERKDALQADLLAIADLGIPNSETPAITLGTRGIVTMDVELTGSSTDLHSGSHGGIVYNPIHALVEILAKCRDSDGKVTVPGFYDDVRSLKDHERAQLYIDFEEAPYKEAFGAEPTGGETTYTPLERAWTRPTLEINGITGGYTGNGFKTVIPSKASCKISCRVVPDQKPEIIGEHVATYLRSLAPKGITVNVEVHAGTGGATRSDINSKGVQAFSQAYQEVFEKPTQYTFEGGSIPIINALAETSEAEVVLIGLGLPDDHMHAPNEHFGVDRLEKGTLIVARALEILGDQA